MGEPLDITGVELIADDPRWFATPAQIELVLAGFIPADPVEVLADV